MKVHRIRWIDFPSLSRRCSSKVRRSLSVRAVVAEGGIIFTAVGQATGADRARKAVQMAMSNEILGYSMSLARNVIFHVSGDKSVSLHEVNQVVDIIRETVDPDAYFHFASSTEDTHTDTLVVKLLASGFE